ncbi:MAG: hypothetical protein AAF206_22325 [Bacteroidota bacterium]
MAVPTDILDQIDRYLTQQMDQAEKISFEKKITTDPELAQWVDKERAGREWIQMYQEEELRESLNALGDQLIAEGPSAGKAPQRIPFRRLAIIGAALAAVIALIFLIRFLTTSPPLTAPQIADTAFALDPVGRTQMGQNTLDQLIAWYQSGQYDSVLAHGRDFTDSEAALLYIGAAYYQSGKTEAAIEQWQQIPNKNLIWEEVQWRIALAHLKLAQTELAIEKLCQIQQLSFHPFKDRAIAVLTELDQPCPRW